MSELTLTVRNYRAIKSADITLADLTVLAGVNASGKSTLARLFHRLVCVESQLPSFAAVESCESFSKLVLSPLKNVIGKEESFFNYLINSCKRRRSGRAVKYINEMADRIEKMLERGDIVELFKDPRSIEALNGYASSAAGKATSMMGIDDVRRWVKDVVTECTTRQNELEKRGAKSAQVFYNAEINGESLILPVEAKPPTTVSFLDDNVMLVDSGNADAKLLPLYSLRNSFYIARPSVDFPSVVGHKLRLNGMEYSTTSNKMSSADNGLLDIGIDTLMGGSVSEAEAKNYTASEDWRFSEEKGATYLLSQCADGIKSLATVSILDRYGLLEKGTLLIIDEPESHLHPQWVVGMARILVRLAKARNVRVLLTTHSPDMVHALRDFAENEGMSSSTRFYLAERNEAATTGYDYHGLGMNIGPIFSMFNVAKEQIAAMSKLIREGAAL